MTAELPPKLCPKIILEGTRLTHKTDLAFILNEHPQVVGPRKYRYHSPIISAEWCAFTNFPWGRGLINFEKHEETLAMETYKTWVKLFEMQRYYSWIIDRFFISTYIYQSGQGRKYDFRWLEERLKELGFCIILCTRSDESFEKAREDRIKVSGKPGQYNDLSLFVKEQSEIKEAVFASILPHLEIDVSDGNLYLAAKKIAGWLQKNKLMGFYS